MSKSPTEQAREYANNKYNVEESTLEFLDGAEDWQQGHAAGVKDTLALAEKLADAISEYKNECETSAPDALYKRNRREQMFKALQEFKLAKGKVTT